ncbi:MULTISPECIES: VOC family protein [Nocardiopsis]|uniref:VOC family protein n=1 Tax=Nocardiopsis TaxID=2013 RepID=UPI0008FC3C75|nr:MULTISPECIES: VOC family protein [Nocardiopsis]APC33352.1 hydroxylase [Nocardiopsis dassonvillei]
MISTDFTPGSPCWVEVSSPDVEASTAFYGHVFGWSAETHIRQLEGYKFLCAEGLAAAGVSPVMGESDHPSWTVYFADSDIEDTITRVERLGGTLLVEPFDIFDLGRQALFRDPQGASFGVWRGEMYLGLVGRVNSLCWVELRTTDARGAAEFYTGVFKWDLSPFDPSLGGEEVGGYTVLRPAGTGDERTHGGILQAGPGDRGRFGGEEDWHPVFAVADCEAVAERVVAAGGHVHSEPENISGVGRRMVCSDPFQAGFVLLNWPPA